MTHAHIHRKQNTTAQTLNRGGYFSNSFLLSNNSITFLCFSRGLSSWAVFFPFERVHNLIISYHFFPKKLVTTSAEKKSLPHVCRFVKTGEISRFFAIFRDHSESFRRFRPGVVPRPVTAKGASTAQLQAVLPLCTSRDVKLTLT